MSSGRNADEIMREMYESLCKIAEAHHHKQGPRGQYTGCRICLFKWGLFNRASVVNFIEGGEK